MSDSPLDPHGEEPNHANSGPEPVQPQSNHDPAYENSLPSPDDAYAPPLTEAIDAELVNERPVGWAVPAWIVIVLVSGGMFYLQSNSGKKGQQEGTTSSFMLRMLEVQGKYVVASSNKFGMDRERAFEQSKAINHGPIDVRLRYVVLAGELAGAEEALNQLDELQRQIEQRSKHTTETQQQLIALLKSLYTDYRDSEWEAPSLSKADRQQLKDKLGWFGLLALGPNRGEDGSSMESSERKEAMSAAEHVFYVLLGCAMLVLALGGAGLVGVVLFTVFIATGKLRCYFKAGSRFGGVYAETFAIWMLLWVGLSLAAAIILRDSGSDKFLVSAVISLSTLVVLAWPLIRGVPARQLVQDIGLIVPGRRAWIEPFWGVVCYVTALPLLGAGFVVTTILMSAFGNAGGTDEFSSPNGPSHPIVESIGDGAWIVWLKMFLVAAVVAPIVEELMFRGLLYRHLRDATAKIRIAVSVLISGSVSSLVFAIIHPQGIFGVPVLMSLAFAFCLAREWRGSIVAPMTMHAINNGSVTLMLLILLSL